MQRFQQGLYVWALVGFAALGLSSNAAIAGPLPNSVVFVSRGIPPGGSQYWSVPNDMPGVGPYSRFRVAAPGRLIVLEPDGSTRVLVDGAAPTAASLNLIDVNAPDVSYDGQWIVFAGLVAGAHPLGPNDNPNAWRLYVIHVNGTGLRQLTFSEDRSQIWEFLRAHDDTDPAWLPDGRVVFSSTRWPAFAHFSGVRTTNLFVVNADGSHLHRITSERSGADRAVIDPVTGKIVFSRFWRNQRFAIDSMATVPDPRGGHVLKDGLSADRDQELDGTVPFRDWLWRNAWHLATVNPDGTALAAWSLTYRNDSLNHLYGGSFGPNGEFYGNHYPMMNMTEAAGFGGIRRLTRGPGSYTGIIGVHSLRDDYVNPNPPSFGIMQSDYAGDVEALADGRLLISWTPNVAQDYGLYVINPDGSGRTLVYDQPGTTELRARVIRPRALPPVLADAVTSVSSPIPPPEGGPYDQDGTFQYQALNVYFNAPVDAEIISAPAVGSAAKIRLFVDHQRHNFIATENLDWPVLVKEQPVTQAGAVFLDVPANLPIFEQLRSADRRVPLTGGPFPNGAAHTAGLNYGRPGEQVRCVGCHSGHSQIPVPATLEEARWTNLAPGASIAVSSEREAGTARGLTDRQVLKGALTKYWTSAADQVDGQWATLTFPIPVTVRSVRLYGPRPDAASNTSLVVNAATVKLFADAAGTIEIVSRSVAAVAVEGTAAAFSDVPARMIRVDLNSVAGTFLGITTAGLAEIEVIASANLDSSTDTDLDGIPDTWEVEYHLDPNDPSDRNADPDGDGQTNFEEYTNQTHPRGFHKRYFAEGATGVFFDTQLALLNTGAIESVTQLRFQRSDGVTITRNVVVPPHSRLTEDVQDITGVEDAEFSTVVESDEAVVIDRTMVWNNTGYGSHAETSMTPSTTWYLAEGATHSGFNLFYLIQNPGNTAAQVEITYLRPIPAPPVVNTVTVAPRSRFTVWVNQADEGLRSTDVSAVVRSLNGVDIIVERAMYRDAGGQLYGAGHESAGVTEPSLTWFLAEGATGPYFDLFVLIANPNATPAELDVTFLLPDGTTFPRHYSVGGSSRFNIWVDIEDAILSNNAVSTTIVSTNGVPVIVERAMWWPGTSDTWYEAHNSPGATHTATTWGLAAGESGGPVENETYILIANTSPQPGSAIVTLFFEDGTTATSSFGIAASSRFNVAVAEWFPQAIGKRYSATVESTGATPVQLVVERAMYSDANGIRWAAGSNALATRLP